MRDIHRSTTTWLARRTGRGSTARPLHRSHRRRLTLEPLEGRALLSLTTWTVNSLGDTGTGSGTSGDLRYVITQADQTQGDNTIDFAVTGTITLKSALPDLSNTTGLMDIEGPGAASLTVARSSASGTPDFGIFTVDANVQAQLVGLAITGGSSVDYGGGIENDGMLTVTNSTIDYNSASQFGGGIGNGGTLTVTNSTIADNSAFYAGGIGNGGTMTVTNSTIDNNTVFGNGGGGIGTWSTMTVTNSTIAGNSALTIGGGIVNDMPGTLTVTNSTIAGNSAPTGGGLWVGGVTALDNTLIALNTSGTGSGATADDIAGTVSSTSAYNLIGTGGSGGLVNGTNGNQVGVADPGLDPNGLQNNGGPTQTIALVTGSPAIDAGSASIPGVTVPATDQRGALRGPAGLNAGTTVDIGAYEASSSYLVTSTADTTDVGTLRAAVGWANVSTNANPANVASPAPNTVTFDTAGTFATPQTITLTQGTLELSNMATPESIAGTGVASLTVARSSAAGTPDFGVFTVDTGVMASLTGLTISGGLSVSGSGIYNAGTLTVTNANVDNNNAATTFIPFPIGGTGGGIYNGGTLIVTNSTIDNNSTGDFGDSLGGGIYNFGKLMVTNSTIDNNFAWDFGGGIDNAGTLIVTNSTIDNNEGASGTEGDSLGGGIYNFGKLMVTNSTIDQNRAVFGGGISNAGTLTVTNSAIDNNGVIGDGGGISNAGTLIVTNSTIADNSDFFKGAGGGIYSSGTLTVTNSTIADNNIGSENSGLEFYGGGGLGVSGGTVALENTIVALNTEGTGSGTTPNDISLSSGGTVSPTSAYNLIGTGGSGGLVNGTNGNQVGVADPGLGPLAYYGGPTQTIDLLPGSPAIDAGSNALAVDPSTGQPLTTDQRGAGFLRIVNGTVDIGAYEYLPAASDTVAVTWGTQTAPLQTAADGLRLLPQGRTTDLPWLGIDSLQVTLSQAQTLTAADVTVNSAIGVDYGPVTVSGSGTSYTITLAQPINAADRVTITIVNPGVSMFNRRLDVLPGDVNDDGVVNVQDLVAIRNQMLGLVGAVPTIFGDINGDGKVDINDYTAVREFIGTTLPSIT